MSSGLQRRRVGNALTGAGDDGEGSSSWSRPHSPTSNGGSASAQHAGSAFEGGSKIAYDPKDLEREAQEYKAGGKMPRLTLMEEVLLLGIKDKQVCVHYLATLLSSADRVGFSLIVGLLVILE